MIDEIASVLKSDKLSGFRGDIGLTEGGTYVKRLEDCFKEYFGVRHAIAYNSATSALHAAVVACEVFAVAVTPFSFSSSASCVLHGRLTPFFTDIDPETYCMNVKRIPMVADSAIVVHLFGGMADMDKLPEVKVIEDAAQALGSKYRGRYAGTIGDCGIFSFNQAKLVSCGEGGMLITNNDDIAFKSKLVRNHGEVVSPETCIVGWNYRMTEIEAIIAYHRFRNLESIIAQRKQNVLYFRELLSEIEGVKPMWINPDVDYSWYVYAFEVENNHDVARRMTEKGIPLRGGYITSPLNKLPIYAYQECPVCEDVWANKIVVTDVIGKSESEIKQFTNTLKTVLKEL